MFLTTSYYVQQLFSTNRGDTIKEVTSDSDFGPVFWCASSKGSTYYVKLANYGQDTQSINVTIPDKTTATLTYVANDDPNAYNSDEQHPGEHSLNPSTIPRVNLHILTDISLSGHEDLDWKRHV